MFITTHQRKTSQLLLRQLGIVIFAVLLVIVSAGTSAAQSTDRYNPTPLKSNELKADFSQDDPEYFYSFTAGPGEVIFTLDVKGATPSGGIPYFHLFTANGRELASFDKFAARNSSELLVKRVSFAKRQPVVLRISKPIGGGFYRLRISGAAAFEREAATDKGGQSNDGIELPAKGTLRIEMTDGSAQEFDLRRVRRAVVKP
jgi:hypothetical protein